MRTLIAAIGLCVSLAYPAQAGPKKELTLTGIGVCAKCALGKTDVCQSALKVQKDGKEVIYFLARNDLSKAFHKNLCSHPKRIVAVGLLNEVDGKKVFTASKLSVSKEVVIRGKGLCLKCALDITPVCQNAIRVSKDGKDRIYILAHNDVSKAFHKNLCKASKPVIATGTVSEVAGLFKFTATKLELAKAKPESVAKAKPEPAPKAEAKPAKKVELVTIKGLGLCAKCELGETDECQNAVKFHQGRKEVVYYLAANDVSKAFHKNLCKKPANIVAVGHVEKGDKPVFVAEQLRLQEQKTLTGTAVCLKCALGKAKTCQNVIKVAGDQGEVLYILDQNAVSRKFHKHVCQDDVKVVAKGTVASINGRQEFTPQEISLR